MKNNPNYDFWQSKKVFITGHTGFKGSWLTLWLVNLGAQVYGYSLAEERKDSVLGDAILHEKIESKIGDICDINLLAKTISEFQPDIVFHLAAQPLVRLSYSEPIQTWKTNLVGTINLLECLKQITKKNTGIFVTTDKVYHNPESSVPFKEQDKLGGYDPYSASKAACELAVESWRKSFYNDKIIKVATVRAGNVIGGGDWSMDRIIPDFIRSRINNKVLKIRNPNAIRPWQHVLEPLWGYICLAEKLHEDSIDYLDSAWNFGPKVEDARSVRELIQCANTEWPGTIDDGIENSSLHEASFLILNSEKAECLLNWKPRLTFEESVALTIQWYQKYSIGMKGNEIALNQIKLFEKKQIN